MEKKKVRKTKIGEILKYMLRYGSITDPIARTKFHTNRLSAFIHVLRQRGWNIQTEMCVGRDEFGRYEYAKYKLVK
jgi:hypothetical protein